MLRRPPPRRQRSRRILQQRVNITRGRQALPLRFSPGAGSEPRLRSISSARRGRLRSADISLEAWLHAFVIIAFRFRRCCAALASYRRAATGRCRRAALPPAASAAGRWPPPRRQRCRQAAADCAFISILSLISFSFIDCFFHFSSFLLHFFSSFRFICFRYISSPFSFSAAPAAPFFAAVSLILFRCRQAAAATCRRFFLTPAAAALPASSAALRRRRRCALRYFFDADAALLVFII